MTLKDLFKKEKVELPNNLFDEFSVNYYGKINNKNKVILPYFSSLKKNDNNINLYYVVEAYDELIKELKEKRNKINKDSLFYFPNISVKTSYVFPIPKYQEHLNNLLYKFIYWIKQYKKNILNFEQFFQYLSIYLFNIEQNSILFNTFYKENLSIFSSGLAIRILNPRQNKEDFFKDPSFKFFQNICLKHNFLISKQNPTTIIFNVKDFYLSETTHTTTDKVEINFFKTLIYVFYLKFIEEFPYELIKSNNSIKKIIRDKTIRIPIQIGKFIDLYLKIFYKEKKEMSDFIFLDSLKIELYKILSGNGSTWISPDQFINSINWINNDQSISDQMSIFREDL